MNYYPQSMGPLRAPFVPYLDQLAVGNERVVYQPHLSTIVPSGGSVYTKRVPIHPPTITVQCETGMFACNFHEIRKDIIFDEENELVVPPWLERNPTPAERAIEERFREQEEHWETKYWAGMEKKMKEAAKAQERVENAGRRPTVTSNVLKPGLSTAPSHIQKADSFRRVLRKEGSAKSGAGSSKGPVDLHSTYTDSECGTARAYDRRQSAASSVASRSAGGRGVANARQAAGKGKSEDVRSITSSTQRYRVTDRTETESICSIISSVYSDEARSLSAKQQSLGHSNSSRAPSGRNVSANAAASPPSTSAVPGGKLATSRTAKMSPRQRMLQQQAQQQMAGQSTHSRLGSSVASLSMASPSSLVSSPVFAAPHPTSTSSQTTPFASKCFAVADGTEPFAWGSPSPIVSAWLKEVLEESAHPKPSPISKATSEEASPLPPRERTEAPLRDENSPSPSQPAVGVAGSTAGGSPSRENTTGAHSSPLPAAEVSGTDAGKERRQSTEKTPSPDPHAATPSHMVNHQRTPTLPSSVPAASTGTTNANPASTTKVDTSLVVPPKAVITAPQATNAPLASAKTEGKGCCVIM